MHDLQPYSQSLLAINDTCNPYQRAKVEIPGPLLVDYSKIATNEKSSSDNVTIVTAYFDLGSFAKGDFSVVYTTEHYLKWMKIFSRIENPVIAFFDSNANKDYFMKLRQINDFENRTHAVVIERSQLWTFNWILPRIAQIFKSRGYPRHYPNTVYPEYSCAMHAKYELMLWSTEKNPFLTKYFAWLDIGLFRSDAGPGEPFTLYLPEKFDKSSVAYTATLKQRQWLTAREIFLRNEVWVCGCFFIGQASVVARWASEYLVHLKLFTLQGLANTDQQVIYAMNNCYLPAVSLQTYKPSDADDQWFYLGYHCKTQGEKRKKELRSIGQPHF